MNAHAQSRMPESYKIVDNYLQRIITQEGGSRALKPTIHLFNLLFKACELAPESIDTESNPVTVAIRRFSQIQGLKRQLESKQNNKSKDIIPSHATYGYMFSICKKHIKNEIKRQKLVRSLFQQCCTDGQLSLLSLELCKDLLTRQSFDEMIETMLLANMSKEGQVRYDSSSRSIEGGIMTIDDFPSDWKRHVGDKSKQY